MLFRYMDGYPVIDEIIIGPKFEDRAKRAMYLQASVDKFYSQPHIGIKSPSITFSTIDYR